MGLVDWFPRRSAAERRADISYSLWDLVGAVGALALGIGLIAAGAWFDEGVLFGIGGLVAIGGAIGLGYALLGMLVSLSIGFKGLGVILFILIAVFLALTGQELLFRGE